MPDGLRICGVPSPLTVGYGIVCNIYLSDLNWHLELKKVISVRHRSATVFPDFFLLL